MEKRIYFHITPGHVVAIMVALLAIMGIFLSGCASTQQQVSSKKATETMREIEVIMRPMEENKQQVAPLQQASEPIQPESHQSEQSRTQSSTQPGSYAVGNASFFGLHADQNGTVLLDGFAEVINTDSSIIHITSARVDVIDPAGAVIAVVDEKNGFVVPHYLIPGEACYISTTNPLDMGRNFPVDMPLECNVVVTCERVSGTISRLATENMNLSFANNHPKVDGTVINSSGRDLSSVEAYALFNDAGGNIIGVAKDTIQGLSRSSTAAFSISASGAPFVCNEETVKGWTVNAVSYLP